MQLLSDHELIALAGSDSGDGNGALTMLSALAARRHVHSWWSRTAAQARGQAAGQAKPPPRAQKPLKAELRAAIARLPAEQQAVVRLRFLEGRSLNEVAARTGMGYDQIRAAQFQALLALAGLLDMH